MSSDFQLPSREEALELKLTAALPLLAAATQGQIGKTLRLLEELREDQKVDAVALRQAFEEGFEVSEDSADILVDSLSQLAWHHCQHALELDSVIEEIVEDQDPNVLKQAIERFLNDPTLPLLFGAYDILGQEERTMLTVHVTSELRPLQPTIWDEEIDATLILHHFKFMRRFGNGTEEFSVILESSDLQMLTFAVEAALKRDRNLREKLARSGMRTFTNLNPVIRQLDCQKPNSEKDDH